MSSENPCRSGDSERRVVRFAGFSRLCREEGLVFRRRGKKRRCRPPAGGSGA